MFGLVPGSSSESASSSSMNWMKNLKNRSLTSDCSDVTDNFRGRSSEAKKPKPPGIPKSSAASLVGLPAAPPTPSVQAFIAPGAVQFGNVTNFKQYRSTRPALLEELNALLNSRLQKDAVTDDARMHNFQVYREAFQRFIDDFNIYKQFLTSVKHEYDSHIEKFAYEIRTVTSLRTELATKEQEYGMLLRTVERAQEHKMVDIDNEKRGLEKNLKEQAVALKNLQSDNVRLTAAANKAIKDFEELRATCNTLTNSLSRLEAERRVNQATQAAKVHEFIALKSTAQKSLDEIDRLRHDKHDLESLQSQMVSQDVVTDHQVTIDTMRSEMKVRDGVHKDLIYRYSLLKQMIDITWNQHVPVAVKNKDKANKEANPAPNAKAPTFKEQTDEQLKKLKDLGDYTESPRVLVETLLSQVIELEKTNSESNPSSGGAGNSFGNANAANNIDGEHCCLSSTCLNCLLLFHSISLLCAMNEADGGFMSLLMLYYLLFLLSCSFAILLSLLQERSSCLRKSSVLLGRTSLEWGMTKIIMNTTHMLITSIITDTVGMTKKQHQCLELPSSTMSIMHCILPTARH